MGQFEYIAVDAAGRRVTGMISGETVESVIARLREAGRHPTRVLSAKEAVTQGGGDNPLHWLVRVSSSEVAILSRQLARLVRGGLPVAAALGALEAHSTNPHACVALGAVRKQVEAGSPLWKALAEQPRLFSPLYVSMVRAGEASGELTEVLEWLANLAEKEEARRSQFRAAMAYPKLLIVLGLAAVVFLLTFLVPRFVDLFAEVEQALPTPTLMLMGIGGFMGRAWWILALFGAASWLVMRYAVATPSGRGWRDRGRLRVPLMGPLRRRIAVGRFARTLGILVKGGVPILEGLAVARETLGNVVLADAVEQARTGVRGGERLADALRATALFPPLLSQMIGIGEETGDVAGALQTVAETLDVEVDSHVKSALALVEPLIILVIGLLVAFILMAMIWPLFELNPAGGV